MDISFYTSDFSTIGRKKANLVTSITKMTMAAKVLPTLDTVFSGQLEKRSCIESESVTQKTILAKYFQFAGQRSGLQTRGSVK